MKRYIFINTALNVDGSLKYEVIFRNIEQDPTEVARSKRYQLELLSSKNIGNPTSARANVDFSNLIEGDWEQGKRQFVVTYGMIVRGKGYSDKNTIQFAGYWI